MRGRVSLVNQLPARKGRKEGKRLGGCCGCGCGCGGGGGVVYYKYGHVMAGVDVWGG